MGTFEEWTFEAGPEPTVGAGGILVDFKLDSESLAKNLNDERFNKIEILITGIDNKSLMCVGV